MSQKPTARDEMKGKVDVEWLNSHCVLSITHDYGGVETTLEEEEVMWLLQKLMQGLDYQPGEYAQIAESICPHHSDAGTAAQAVEASHGE